MKALQENQSTTEEQSFIQASHESQSDQKNNDNAANEAPAADSGSVSVSVSSNEGRRVSREDIELVQNLIERCLQLYMNKDEVVKTLLTRARIDPGFTSLVWQKLEEENADFFRAYYIRLKLKKQIIMFNHLIEHQYRMLKCTVPSKAPLAPAQNGLNPMPPVNNLPMGYPVLQPHHVPVPGQSYINLMGHEVSSCHMVKGVPASGNFQPLRMNSANDMVIENSSVDAAPVIPPSSGMSTMSDMPISPTSVASSGHFPFTAPEITGMEIPWTFSLSDLTADLSNLGDLGPLGNYPGSPFLPSDSDILLDSPEPEDIVEEFFVDSVPGPPFAPSDEEKP